MLCCGRRPKLNTKAGKNPNKRTQDPTEDQVRKMCTAIRAQAGHNRALIHYNGHGVPRPTANGEIWVFNSVSVVAVVWRCRSVGIVFVLCAHVLEVFCFIIVRATGMAVMVISLRSACWIYFVAPFVCVYFFSLSLFLANRSDLASRRPVEVKGLGPLLVKIGMTHRWLKRVLILHNPQYCSERSRRVCHGPRCLLLCLYARDVACLPPHHDAPIPFAPSLCPPLPTRIKSPIPIGYRTPPLLGCQSYTQYIPLPVHRLKGWAGTPAIFVLDCSAAGVLLRHFVEPPQEGEDDYGINPDTPPHGDGSGLGHGPGKEMFISSVFPSR